MIRSSVDAPNNSFKPNLLRYGKGMAEKACHAFASTTQVGLTQALARTMDTGTTSLPSQDKPVSGARRMVDLLTRLGEKLGFNVFTEVEASEAAWIDVVWFDPRFANAHAPGQKPKLRRVPVLPVVAFEVENKTGLNAKHVKGSVSNLNNAGAQMGVIVIGNESFAMLGKQPAYAAKEPAAVESELLARTYRWIHAEAQPKGRIVLMSERELNEWSSREGVSHE